MRKISPYFHTARADIVLEAKETLFQKVRVKIEEFELAKIVQ